MFCMKCGKKIADNAEFCPECGEKIKINSKKEKKIKIPTNYKDIKTYVLKNKIKSIIIAVVCLLIILGIVFAVVFSIINSGKEKAYNEGINFINANNIKEAKESFESAAGYKDADIYYAAVNCADELYNGGNSGEALTSITNMLDKNNNIETITKYNDRESSKIACFMLGEVYFANKNLTDADKYYSIVPITYKVFNKSAYERRAIITLTGSWNIHHRNSIEDESGTHSGEVDYTMTFAQDGTYSFPGFPRTDTTDHRWYFYDYPRTGTWSVDLSHNGEDGVYYFIWDGEKEDDFTISSGVLQWSHEDKGNSSNSSSSTNKGTKIS